MAVVPKCHFVKVWREQKNVSHSGPGIDDVTTSLTKQHDQEEQEVPALKTPTTVK